MWSLPSLARAWLRSPFGQKHYLKKKNNNKNEGRAIEHPPLRTCCNMVQCFYFRACAVAMATAPRPLFPLLQARCKVVEVCDGQAVGVRDGRCCSCTRRPLVHGVVLAEGNGQAGGLCRPNPSVNTPSLLVSQRFQQSRHGGNWMEREVFVAGAAAILPKAGSGWGEAGSHARSFC